MARFDPVVSFVREARGSADRTEERLRKLSLLQGHSTGAGSPDRGPPSDGQSDIVDALRARDEQLSAVVDELRTHIETLTRAVALLEREHSKYVDLFAHAPDAYVVTDMHGNTEDANVAAGALFGVEPRFFVGRLLIAFVARQDTHAFRAFLNGLGGVEPGEGPRAIALRMRPRGQPVMLVHTRATVVRGGAGGPMAVRWTLRRADLGDARKATSPP